MQLLLVAALLAVLGNVSALSFTQCQNAYNANVPSCVSVQKLTRCTLAVLNNNYNAEVAAQAATFLNTAWSNVQDCSLSSVNNFAATVASVNGSIDIQLGSEADFQLTNFARTTLTASNIVDRLNALAGNASALESKFDSLAQDLATLAASTATAASINVQASTSLESVEGLVSSYTTIATNWRNWFHGNMSAINTYNAQTAQPALQAEENALATWQYNTLNTINAYRLALQLGLADDASDVSSIAGEDQGLIATAIASINTNINGFMITEASRATAKTAVVLTELSAMRSGIVSDLAVAISTEVSSATAKTISLTSSLTSKFATQTGSNDLGACTVDGATYYSSATGRVYTCIFTNNKIWTPITFLGRSFVRAGSAILTKTRMAQDIQLSNLVGLNGVWIKCFDASVNGFSGSTFHSLCNGKGATMTISLSSANTIFGGYVDQSWTSRNGPGWAGNSFLWRINSGNNVQTVGYASSVQSSATYDYFSYCPCFGYSSDYWNPNCNSPSFSANYYTGQSYGSAWLSSGYTSISLSRLEVYYLSRV